MLPRPLSVSIITIAAAFVMVRAQDRSPASWSVAIEQLSSPAGPDSGQPQLTSSARGLLLSWIERDGPTAALKFSERTAAGWSAPRTVASGSDWFVNWADVPSVVRLADGTLAGHWLQKSSGSTYAYDVRLAYSRDEGATWSPSFTPHSDGTKTEHGFASLFEMPGGGLGLVGAGLALDDRVDQFGLAQPAEAVDTELVGEQVQIGEWALLQRGAVQNGGH